MGTFIHLVTAFRCGIQSGEKKVIKEERKSGRGVRKRWEAKG